MSLPGRGPLGNWRKKAVGGLLLIAFAPLLFVVAVRAADETARALAPIIPYAFVVLTLFGIYKLVLGRRRM